MYSEIVTSPSNTIERIGKTVVLPCVTDRRTCSDVDWAKQEGIQSSVAIFKSGSGMLNEKNYPLERYNVSSVDGCNLTVRRLKLSDSGLFSCSEAKDNVAVSRYVSLVVVGMLVFFALTVLFLYSLLWCVNW